MTWNSTFNSKPKPMKRAPMKRSTKPMTKSHGQRRTEANGRGQRYLDACKAKECYLQVPDVCCDNYLHETTVPAHSNMAKHGKGAGIKALGWYSVPACAACHAWLDQGPADRIYKDFIFMTALVRWVPVRAALLGEPETPPTDPDQEAA